jgi:hypothetical protein
MEMDRTELIEGLACVGCGFIADEATTAISIGHFTEACREAFQLTHEEQTKLVQRIVDKCIGKFKLRAV